VRGFLIVALGGLLCAACDDTRGVWDADATDLSEPADEEVGDAADVVPDGPPADRPVDVLIVMQNSMTMSHFQRYVAGAYPVLIGGLLDPTSGHRPMRSLHMGVISTDMGVGGYPVERCPEPVDGDDGEMQNSPNVYMTECETSYPRYLSYESETPDGEMIDSLQRAIECIATLGTSGCRYPQPLKATPRALIDHRDGVNAGFLREDSILVILFVADANDCSVTPGSEAIFDPDDSSLGHVNLRCFENQEALEPVETYIAALESLRASPDDLVLGFIAGVAQDPACDGTGLEIGSCLELEQMVERIDTDTPSSLVPCCGELLGGDPYAFPSRRLVQVAQDFGPRAHVQSVCDIHYSQTMNWIADRVHEIVGG
jgi:hypothetical protein